MWRKLASGCGSTRCRHHGFSRKLLGNRGLTVEVRGPRSPLWRSENTLPSACTQFCMLPCLAKPWQPRPGDFSIAHTNFCASWRKRLTSRAYRVRGPASGKHILTQMSKEKGVTFWVLWGKGGEEGRLSRESVSVAASAYPTEGSGDGINW